MGRLIKPTSPYLCLANASLTHDRNQRDEDRSRAEDLTHRGNSVPVHVPSEGRRTNRNPAAAPPGRQATEIGRRAAAYTDTS